MRIVASVLALAVAGCSSPVADWYGDARFTVEERAAIESGEAWLASHAGRQPATFAWNYDVSGDQPLDHTIRRERGPYGETTTTGLCTGSTVYLDPDDPSATPGTLDGLAAHEMGHCELGFVDDPTSGGLMHIISPMRWTDREEAQLAK